MGTTWGNEGVVKVGANAVVEVRSFELNEAVDPVEDTAMGDTHKTHIAGSGHKEWSGTITCWWDKGDTNGQEALTIGASVTLNLFPEGDASGSRQISGLASITGIGVPVNMGDVVERTFEFRGNGALTRSNVV